MALGHNNSFGFANLVHLFAKCRLVAQLHWGVFPCVCKLLAIFLSKLELMSSPV